MKQKSESIVFSVIGLITGIALFAGLSAVTDTSAAYWIENLFVNPRFEEWIVPLSTILTPFITSLCVGRKDTGFGRYVKAPILGAVMGILVLIAVALIVALIGGIISGKFFEVVGAVVALVVIGSASPASTRHVKGIIIWEE